MTADTATAPREARFAPFDRLLSLRLAISWELVLYAVVFAAAFGLRFWDLGSRALHHDESIHAQWSWKLIQGDYTHSPIFHGPLYYHAQGLVFLIFGDSDYTSRVSAAIFGMGIVALPLLLRRRLGPVGTFAAVALIAFSPTLVYYSRFVREDIYMALFTLLTVISTWRYIDEGRQRWLYVFAAAFVGAVLVKEGAFLTFAVFLVYLDLHLSSELARRMLLARGLEGDRWRQFAVTFFLAPYAWIIAAFWPFAPGLRRRFDLGDELPRTGDLLVLLGTFTLPLLTPVSRVFLLEPLGIVAEERLNWQQNFAGGSISANDALALAGLFAITTSAAAFVGLQWKPKVWAIAFTVGTLVYLTFMTSFWTNEMGLVSGPWGSLDYWYSQHDATRGDQPWFYYYLLMPAYEFLPLTIAIGGAWWSIVRGTAFSRFLWAWLAGMWLALSWGGEKMPWLNVHLALPAAMLAAWTVQRAWDAWRERPASRSLALPLVSIAAIAAGALVLVAFLPSGALYHGLRLVILLGAIGVVGFTAQPWGRRAVGTVAVVACVGALSFFSLRTMVGVVFERGDVPKDMLIYTQSSPDIPDIKSEIDRLAEATGLGKRMPIAVDSSDSFAWPWAWYLRDYKAVSYTDMSNGTPKGAYQVLLVNNSNVGRVTDTLANSGVLYGSPRRYPHRWWFDESYKHAMAVDGVNCTAKHGVCGPFRPATWKHIFSNVFDGSWPKTWALYLRDHDPDRLRGGGAATERRCSTCGSVDAWVYFPANFDPATGHLSARPIDPPAPTVDEAGRTQFGGPGLLPGQFMAPAGIATDRDGNLYVVDTATSRLQKFDAQGNFIASTDVRGNDTELNEAAEPWGVTVAPDGSVVVADTFGWKVRVFDAELNPVREFGQAPRDIDAADPPLDELYGPRDVAIDADGNLWVTDTGFDRIVVFSPEGEPLRAIGAGEGAGEGQFDEPVGIDIADDGTVFVADMFNARVVMLNAGGEWLGAFAVEGWGGRAITDKPYLAALGDGNVAVTLPSLNEVRIYNRSGELISQPGGGAAAFDGPVGVVEAAEGLWIVENGSGLVRLFER